MKSQLQPLKKPVLVIVTGASGSGKTTLAARLVESIGLYHVNRDRLKFGIEYTTKTQPQDRKTTVMPRYYAVLDELLHLQVSCIADGVQHQGSEGEITRYADTATVLNVHCSADKAPDRKAQWREDIRMRVEQGEEMIEYEPGHFPPLKQASGDPAARPLDHGFPMIGVNTDDGYDPELSRIVEWIGGQVKQAQKIQ